MSNADSEMVGTTQEKQDGGQSFLVGGLFLTLPFVFFWFVRNGMGFIEAYVAYIHVAVWAAGIIGGITAGVTAIKSRWPNAFESPNQDVPWHGFAAGGVALLVSIVAGYFSDFTNGALLFWPTTVLALCVLLICNWIIHQTKRWWTIWQACR